MKLSLLLLATFIAVIYCAPNIAIDESQQEKLALENFNTFFDSTKIFSDIFLNKLMVTIVAKTTDRNCMLAIAKKHNLMELVSGNDLVNKISLDVILTSAVLCSRLIDVEFDYFFDLLMTHHGLLKAYLEEPELKEYADKMTCLGQFAIEHHILDPKVYAFKYELDDEEEEEICMTSTERMERMWQNQMLLSNSCSKKLAEQFRFFAVKYILLVQVEMKDDQRQQERKNFNKALKEFLENRIQCVGE